MYIYIYPWHKDEAKALSLLDHFGHFDVPLFDAKAQVFDPRSSIRTFDAEAPALDTRSAMLKWVNPENLIYFLENLTKL